MVIPSHLFVKAKASMGVSSYEIEKLAVVVLLIVAQVELSTQLKPSDPMHDIVDKVNSKGSYLGVAVAFPGELDPLLKSGLFLPDSNIPPIQHAGRIFHVGEIKGVAVIYVITGEKGVNAAVGIHTLLQVFNIGGLIWYGMSGCANTSMSVGDVGVPTAFAFTSSYRWLEYGSTDTDPKEFKFGNYNLPEAGDNLLERLLPEPIELFQVGKPVEERYWYSVDPHWYKLATELKNVKLDQCVNATTCLPYVPKIAFGLKGSTADIFMSNVGYAQYLLNTHGVSTVDEESAAVVHASITYGVPCIVFRGISDVAGKQHINVAGVSALAATNSFKVALKFIELLRRERSTTYASY